MDMLRLNNLDTGISTSLRPATKFRVDIEGLRALAVLSVVGFHYHVFGLNGGFIGVDVFFVISGYLITELLLREIAETGKIDLLKFYGRRARRLLPAALLVTIVSLAFGYMILPPFEQKTMAKLAVASSLYATNFLLLKQSLNYFAPESSLNPFLHTWSLSVEEQFYIVWPALLFVASRRSGRFLQTTLVSVTLSSFILCAYLTYTNQSWAFYLSPTRAWEFGLGGLASLAPTAGWVKNSLASAVVGWIAFAVLLISLFLIDEFSSFPGFVALVPVLATSFILVGGQNTGGPRRLLENRLLQFFGTRSYAIYLWHWPILVLGSALLAPSIMTMTLYFALTVALSSLSFTWLEQPIRSSKWIAARPMRSGILGLVLTLCGLIAGSASFLNATRATSPFQTAVLETIDKPTIATQNGCLAGFLVSTPIRCIFGASDYNRTLVIFGDSHADQWSTALTEIANRNRWRLITYLKSSCSASNIEVYNMRLRRFSPECAIWRKEAIARITAERPDAVLVFQFSSGYIKGSLTGLGPHAVDLATWERGLTQTIADLQSANSPIILVRDTPTPYHPVGNCLARADWRGYPLSKCGSDRNQAVDDSVTEAEQRAVSGSRNTSFIDLNSVICEVEKCPPILGGVIVYRDANHLSVDFTLQLEAKMNDSLISIVGAPDRK
jgi:peptidoglycan/LPS O-acetylase OafA/YrhL